MIKILRTSKSRINPHCEAFNRGCGGCQWLNVKYPDQLYWKTKIARDALKHIGKINDKVLPLMVLEIPPAIARLMKFNSHEIICFKECNQILKSSEDIYHLINKLGIPPAI